MATWGLYERRRNQVAAKRVGLYKTRESALKAMALMDCKRRKATTFFVRRVS